MSGTAGFSFRPEYVVDLFLRSYKVGSAPMLSEVHRQVEELLVGPFAALKPHLDEIVQEILRRIDVRIGTASVLESEVDHQPWLEEVDRTGWRLWPRLVGYLRDIDRLPASVLDELNHSTDQVLERLESPSRSGRWDRRGLVVGHVQSGKTTHYTSLAAKAIDAGYRVVIILAGVHNNLRSQTHERIDKHLIGRDSLALGTGQTATPRLAGVGEYARELVLAEPPFSILTCTTAAENGDFRQNTAQQVWFQVNEGARLVMVVKKNATILRKLRDWLRTLLADVSAMGAEALIRHPTLFIDDEADHASVNTRDPEEDPSTINGLIRELLVSFSHVGLVGYTATPFANIFIDPTPGLEATRFGPDLFPKSFIVNLKPPSDYIGPPVVFGHPGDDSVGIPKQDPLPMYVRVGDSQAWIPSPHKKEHLPGPIPHSLQEAIKLFVLVCAVRSLRGHIKAHNSMLIHATRFVLVQNQVAAQVEREVAMLQNILAHGSPSSVAEQEASFRDVWDRNLVANHRSFRERLGDRCSELPDWALVWPGLADVCRRVKVMRVNGSSDDSLAYARATDGLWVIAIGGDKLSRGLTLEGLSVSYFLRTSNMFDTLMQMGRWFGYRPRYADLCRVFTTPDLHRAFREIALAVEDLRADLDRMALANRTPEEFGLRVRTPSDGLLITAANKIRRGEPVQVRYAGELVQSLRMPSTGNAAQANRDALAELITALPKPERTIRGESTQYFVWHQVDVGRVVALLSHYTAFRTQSFLNQCEQLRRYIKDRVEHNELREWTVCLISKRTTKMVTAGTLKFGVIERKPEETPPSGQFGTEAVAGRVEEAADLSSTEYKEALRQTLDEERKAEVPEGELSKWPSRGSVRAVRPATRGLLLLYPIEQPSLPKESYVLSAAISFPKSDTATALTYTVNEVWRAEFGLGDDLYDGAESS